METLAGYQVDCHAFLGDGGVPPALLLVNDGEMLEEMLPVLAEGLRGLPPFILAGVCPRNRDGEYSPWPMEPVFRGGGAFSGGADGYVERLVSQLLPLLRERYGLEECPARTGILGYSLGGLAALYAAYRTDAFGLVGSLSSSLWFAGWEEFACGHPLRAENPRVFFSLGKREPMSRNPVLAAVGKATERTAAALEGQAQVRFVWEEGGHFGDVSPRFVRAIRWLLGGENGEEGRDALG